MSIYPCFSWVDQIKTMWQDDYLESLDPESGPLDEMGLSTQFLKVSLAFNDTEKWDHSFAASVIASVPTMLEILEDTGFFFLLGKLSGLLKGLKASGLLSDVWKAPEGGALQSLAPIFRLLVQLTPRKIYHSFWCLRDFLEDADEEDFEGPDCLRYLTAVQQGLEDLEPQKTLNCLADLHDFLLYQYPYLMWLASHPDVQEKVGDLNLFPTLMIARKVLGFGMEYFHDCLVDLQEVLEDLNEVEAVVHTPDDLDMF